MEAYLKLHLSHSATPFRCLNIFLVGRVPFVGLPSEGNTADKDCLLILSKKADYIKLKGLQVLVEI